jgi:hypothetical protein
MPDWISNSWVVTIVGGVAVLIIFGLLTLLWKGFRTAIVHFWNKITEHRGPGGPIGRPKAFDLTFVEFHSFCGVQQQKDGQWQAQNTVPMERYEYFAFWTVCQSSESSFSKTSIA